MGGGGPARPPGGPPAGGGHPGAPDSPKVRQLVDQAAQLLRQAEDLESDVEDKAMLADLVARLRKFTGSQQAMIDKAIGAGPGVKLVRKANAGSY
jgi:hypothetical protein